MLHVKRSAVVDISASDGPVKSDRKTVETDRTTDECGDAAVLETNEEKLPSDANLVFDGANGGMAQGTSPPLLRGINFEATAGSLTAVCGPIAAGKTSLLMAILGEMFEVPRESSVKVLAVDSSMVQVDGVTGATSTVCAATTDGSAAGDWNLEAASKYVHVRGRLAYVPQQAWILNATIRDNVLFGLPYDKARFDAVMEACCLDVDLKSMPAGEFTEIGNCAPRLHFTFFIAVVLFLGPILVIALCASM